METKSSESKKIGKIRKGVGNRSGFQGQSKVRENIKKASYAIGKVSEKDLSMIIKEFEKIRKQPYEKMIPNMRKLQATFI